MRRKNSTWGTRHYTNLSEYNRSCPPASSAHATSIPALLLFSEKSKMPSTIRYVTFALAFVLATLSSVPAGLRAQDKSKSPVDRMLRQSNTSSGRFYNERGSSIGRIESRNGSARVYDASGRSTGRVESRNGSTRFYSSSGSVIERSTTSGDLTRFYDKSGRSIGTSRTSGTSTRFYNSSGAYQGKAEKSNSGTIRFYDSSGRSLGTKRP